jgi:hypothetical protein
MGEGRPNFGVWLVLVVVLHICGLYFFVSGFFLTRFGLAEVSECSVLPMEDLELLRSLDQLDDRVPRAGELGAAARMEARSPTTRTHVDPAPARRRRLPCANSGE